MANEFFAAIEQAEEDRGKFLVIKSSDDNVFCAGGDLNDFHSELNVEEIFPHLYKMKEVLNALVTFPVPTICLLRLEEHTSELQSRGHLVCRLLLEKKKKTLSNF